MKNRILTYLLAIFGALLMFTNSCKKEEINFQIPVVNTAQATFITQTTAKCGGTITSDGGTAVTARGVCWSNDHNPTVANSKTIDSTGKSSFTSSITGLVPSTTYYVRAYATNDAGTSYGKEISFITKQNSKLPTLNTTDISFITQTTAKTGGIILSTVGDSITANGVCWSTIELPTIVDTKTSDSLGGVSFISTITGLTPGTTYYVRAYATNSAGTGYGFQRNFTTYTIPTLITLSVTNITSSTCISGGNILKDGGTAITARGICYSTTPNPTIANDTTNNGTGRGIFTTILSGLSLNTTYYLRSYATNIIGTAYGSEVSFTTKNGIITLSTKEISDIGGILAGTGGNITNDGGAIITARGVCYSTSSNPTTANSTTINDSDTNIFFCYISGLTTNTTYYVRAYATNNKGTYYGNELSFNSGYTFGTAYAGGIVFYNDGIGGGLVYSGADQDTALTWGCKGTTIGGTFKEIYTGILNTYRIVNVCNTGNTAAKYCDNLVLNSYVDWFLPSQEELRLLQKNIYWWDRDGFVRDFYWSSTEYDGNYAYCEYFPNGIYHYPISKDSVRRVRPIRAFDK